MVFDGGGCNILFLFKRSVWICFACFAHSNHNCVLFSLGLGKLTHYFLREIPGFFSFIYIFCFFVLDHFISLCQGRFATRLFLLLSECSEGACYYVLILALDLAQAHLLSINMDHNQWKIFSKYIWLECLECCGIYYTIWTDWDSYLCQSQCWNYVWWKLNYIQVNIVILKFRQNSISWLLWDKMLNWISQAELETNNVRGVHI